MMMKAKLAEKILGIPMHSEWEPEHVDFIADNT